MRNRLPWLLLIAVMLSLGIAPFSKGDSLAPAGPAVQPNADTVAIVPAATTVQAGETFSLEVRIEGDTLVVASDVQILFDTTYLECLSVVNSGIFDGYFIDSSDLTAGKIWVGGGTFDTRTPPFTFVTLNFRAKNDPGDTELTFNPAETSIEGESGSVLGGVVNGAVTITTTTAAPVVTISAVVDDTAILRPERSGLAAGHSARARHRSPTSRSTSAPRTIPATPI